MSNSQSDTINLDRRIRRHMHAPMHEWFAPCAPGLEDIVERELAGLGISELASTPGGVTFKGRLEDGYRANLELRTANRILLRVEDFRAGAPSDIVRRAGRIPWELYLTPGTPLIMSVTRSESRIQGDSPIEEPLYQSIVERMQAAGMNAPFLATATEEEGGQRLFARLDHNRLTISLDSSGEHLHRRGYRRMTGAAPMRENLAAGILLAVRYDPSMPLVDGMTGSGTFAIEAALMAAGKAPGSARSFAFETWPSFRKATWEHLKKKANERVTVPGAAIVGRDQDQQTINIARENTKLAGFGDVIVFKKADFFKAAPPDGQPGLIVLNPPYGHRLKTEGKARELIEKVEARLQTAWKGWRFALVAPADDLPQRMALKVDGRLLLPHGGIRVSVMFGSV